MRILPRSLTRTSPVDPAELVTGGHLVDLLRVNLIVADAMAEVDDLNRAITEPHPRQHVADLTPPPIIKGRPQPRETPGQAQRRVEAGGAGGAQARPLIRPEAFDPGPATRG